VKAWYIYLLLCNDESFYCGCTTDVQARLATHQAGKGSKYVRSRLPAQLAYVSGAHGTRGEAQRMEAAVKGMTHGCKLGLTLNWMQRKLEAMIEEHS